MFNLRNHALVFSRLGSQNVHRCNLITVMQLEQVEITGFFCTAHQNVRLMLEGGKLAKLTTNQNTQHSVYHHYLAMTTFSHLQLWCCLFFFYKGTEWPSSDKLQDLRDNLLEENAAEHGFSSSRFPHITWNYLETQWWIYWYNNCKVGSITPSLFHCCSESYAFEWGMSGCSHCAVQVFLFCCKGTFLH